jgi:hypothetical protein
VRDIGKDRQGQERYRIGQDRKVTGTIEGITGTGLDARLKHAVLTDPVFQADLTGDEFRAFWNLVTWTVAQVSDGFFQRDRTRMIPNLTSPDIDRFIELGLVEHDDDGNCRIAPAYWSWQSSLKDLERLSQRRQKARERQADVRSVSPVARDMVKSCGVPSGHQTKLGSEVDKLLADGVDPDVIQTAVWEWLTHKDALPELLPSLVRCLQNL